MIDRTLGVQFRGHIRPADDMASHTLRLKRGGQRPFRQLPRTENDRIRFDHGGIVARLSLADMQALRVDLLVIDPPIIFTSFMRSAAR